MVLDSEPWLVVARRLEAPVLPLPVVARVVSAHHPPRALAAVQAPVPVQARAQLEERGRVTTMRVLLLAVLADRRVQGEAERVLAVPVDRAVRVAPVRAPVDAAVQAVAAEAEVAAAPAACDAKLVLDKKRSQEISAGATRDRCRCRCR